MRPRIGHRAFTAHNLDTTLKLGRNRAMRTIITRKHHQCILEQIERLKLLHNPPHQLIGIRHHIGKIARIPFIPATSIPPFRAIGRRNKRRVNQNHRIIGKKRHISMTLNKIQQIITTNIGTIPTFNIIVWQPFPITFNLRICISPLCNAGRIFWKRRHIPQTMLVKPKMRRHLIVFTQLPLTRNTRSIPRIL